MIFFYVLLNTCKLADELRSLWPFVASHSYYIAKRIHINLSVVFFICSPFYMFMAC